jgi:hypothetical protein
VLSCISLWVSAIAGIGKGTFEGRAGHQVAHVPERAIQIIDPRRPFAGGMNHCNFLSCDQPHY